MRYLLDLDVRKVIGDLHKEWIRGPNYYGNVHAFSKVRDTSNNLMMCCPYHEETGPSFSIMKYYPYAFHCFGCGEKGTVGNLVSFVYGLGSEEEGYSFLIKQFYVEETKLPELDVASLFKNEEAFATTETEDSVMRYRTKIHSYITNRGISKYTLNKYEVGYDEASMSITFPVRDLHGTLRYVQRRAVQGKSFLNERGVKKRDIVYGLYYLALSKQRVDTVYLNESIIDTLSCYESGMAACALTGRFLFEQQVIQLLKVGIRNVVLFFDNDEAGSELTAKAITKLMKYPISLAKVEYPSSEFKDPNELLVAGEMSKIKLLDI